MSWKKQFVNIDASASAKLFFELLKGIVTQFADNYNRSQIVSLLANPAAALFNDRPFIDRLTHDLEQPSRRVDTAKLLALLLGNNSTQISVYSDYKSVSAVIER